MDLCSYLIVILREKDFLEVQRGESSILLDKTRVSELAGIWGFRPYFDLFEGFSVLIC